MAGQKELTTVAERRRTMDGLAAAETKEPTRQVETRPGHWEYLTAD